MLPFSSFEFFLVMLYFIVTLLICRRFAANSNYKTVLFILNLLFIVVFYPQPYHFLLLIVFAYVITYLNSNVFRFRKRLPGVLLLLIPLLLVKFDIRFDFYPFTLNSLMSFAGLSYASFRIVSYYMDKAPGEKMCNFLSYFNYLSFTPTLLIGPIDRYRHFKESEDKGFSQMNAAAYTAGWNMFIKGLAFKYILAEIVDRYWLNIYDPSDKDAMAIVNSMYAYYFFLFFDFAGYSHMALSIGKFLGIEVPVNFTNPFVAKNPQDFWRRFHITLGDWLKDYFFTPIYMSLTRKKSLKNYPLFRQNISLFLTFLLMGCWNGFQTNFILSGMLFGLYSLVHNTYIVKSRQKQRDIVFGKLDQKAVNILSIFITFNLTAFALYVFSGRFPFL